MGTKVEPGKYDCYGAAKDDEPLFTLLARDGSAPRLVEAWAQLRQNAIAAGVAPSTDIEKVEDARQCAVAMRQWHFANKTAEVAHPEAPIEVDNRRIVEELQKRRTKAYAEVENLVSKWCLTNCDSAAIRVVRELRDQLSVLTWRHMTEAYNVGTNHGAALVTPVAPAPTPEGAANPTVLVG